MQNIRVQEEQAFRRFFGKRLRLARKAVNLSQKGLAYRLRTGQDTISNYERGKVIPNMLTLYHIAEILGVNVSYFFPDARFSSLSEEEQETLALIASLSPAVYEFILGFIQTSLQDWQSGYFKNLRQDPILSLERFINGHINSLGDKSNSLYLLLGLTVILFEGLQQGRMLSRNRQLLQRIINESYLLNTIVCKLINPSK